MSYSPYRAIHDFVASRAERAEADLDMFPVLAIFWVASLIQVVYAWSFAETFGVEATLAAIAVLFVPLLLIRRLRLRA